ncbi:MAG: universal stress protein [Sphingomonas sp.]|jgi:nucleotide-binding universal stress UspA family protein|uniref:universal stress protein n=1 Tax=Sphingomonas sp. TaxID=28214 RepID=UPI003562F650
MKNILVLVHDDPGQEARIQVALDIVRAVDGHLICLEVEVMPVLSGDMARTNAIIMADEDESGSANRARLEPRILAEQLPFSWIEQRGFLSPTIRSIAGPVDLIVLNRDLDAAGSPDMGCLVAEVLSQSAMPVVAAPEQVRRFDIFGHALVAWDGSPQAEAALRAAIPLLRHAGAVSLLEVDDGSLSLPVSEAAAYLARHGIQARIVRERPLFALPSSLILKAIGTIQAAYVVMGGFGHSPFVEAAFGGVTRHLLQSCPVPILLAR